MHGVNWEAAFAQKPNTSHRLHSVYQRSRRRLLILSRNESRRSSHTFCTWSGRWNLSLSLCMPGVVVFPSRFQPATEWA